MKHLKYGVLLLTPEFKKLNDCARYTKKSTRETRVFCAKRNESLLEEILCNKPNRISSFYYPWHKKSSSHASFFPYCISGRASGKNWCKILKLKIYSLELEIVLLNHPAFELVLQAFCPRANVNDLWIHQLLGY